jgi:hypothetical protein
MAVEIIDSARGFRGYYTILANDRMDSVRRSLICPRVCRGLYDPSAPSPDSESEEVTVCRRFQLPISMLPNQKSLLTSRKKKNLLGGKSHVSLESENFFAKQFSHQ